MERVGRGGAVKVGNLRRVGRGGWVAAGGSKSGELTAGGKWENRKIVEGESALFFEIEKRRPRTRI